ncbi:MAG: hypothetical protein ACK5LO_01115 [Leucobacter sp.]
MSRNTGKLRVFQSWSTRTIVPQTTTISPIAFWPAARVSARPSAIWVPASAMVAKTATTPNAQIGPGAERYCSWIC